MTINIISSGLPGQSLESAPRYRRTLEVMHIVRDLLDGKPVDFHGEFMNITLDPPRLRPVRGGCPPFYFGGLSEAAREVAAQAADVFLMWPDTLSGVGTVLDDMRARAARYGRTLRFGYRAHVIVRATEAEARAAAQRLVSRLDDAAGDTIRRRSLDTSSAGTQRQNELRDIADDDGYAEPNLWTGIGRARSGAGAAIVGDPDQVLAKIRAYADLGMDAFILSGYPHAAEADLFARHVLPHLTMHRCSRAEPRPADLSHRPHPGSSCGCRAVVIVARSRLNHVRSIDHKRDGASCRGGSQLHEQQSRPTRPSSRPSSALSRRRCSCSRPRGSRRPGSATSPTGQACRPSALYHYMGSKDELLVAFMVESMTELTRVACAALDGAAGPAAQLAALVRAHVGFHTLDAQRSLVADDELRALSDAAFTKVMQLRDGYERLWAETLERGMRSGEFSFGDARITRLALLEMCNGVARWYSDRGPKHPAEIAESFADLALAMVGARRDGAAAADPAMYWATRPGKSSRWSMPSCAGRRRLARRRRAGVRRRPLSRWRLRARFPFHQSRPIRPIDVRSIDR